MTTGALLRQLLQERRGLLVPGAANALAAKAIDMAGFEAVYLSGAGLTNTFYGMPDLGFMSLQDVASHTSAIRQAVGLPLIVDADTGFGNALNVRHTVKTLERAGANAIQLEDQAMPKKCGHFNDKSVISCAEMVDKVRAAVDARTDQDTLIMARTDARAIEGFEAAIARAQAYADAGADITFVEAPVSLDEVQRIPQALSCPQVINVVIGGKTPVPDPEVLRTWGFGMILYANAALQGALLGMHNALHALHRDGQLLESSGLVASFEARQAAVDKDIFDQLARRYSH